MRYFAFRTPETRPEKLARKRFSRPTGFPAPDYHPPMTTLYHRLDDSPRGQIIKLLQRHGAWASKTCGSELGVSDTAVRQQLQNLLADGLIRASTSSSSGPGRPSRLYELTGDARSLFACYGEDLALNLYAELLADQGPDVVGRLLDRVGERMAVAVSA